jgi:hypothetical protein
MAIVRITSRRDGTATEAPQHSEVTAMTGSNYANVIYETTRYASIVLMRNPQ